MIGSEKVEQILILRKRKRYEDGNGGKVKKRYKEGRNHLKVEKVKKKIFKCK